MKLVRSLLLAALVAGAAVAWVTLDDGGRRAFEGGPASAWSWAADTVASHVRDASAGGPSVASNLDAGEERVAVSPTPTSTQAGEAEAESPSQVAQAAESDADPVAANAPSLPTATPDDADAGPPTDEHAADIRSEPNDPPLDAASEADTTITAADPTATATPTPTPMPLGTPTPTPTPTPSVSAGSPDAASEETSQPSPPSGTLSPEALALLAALNESRGHEGLPPLQPVGTLQAIAASHAADLASQQALSHTGSDGRGLLQRLHDGGAQFGAAGENVARGHGGAGGMPSVADAFLASPIHRANVLNAQFVPVGIGVVIDAQGYSWITVVFTD
jgi:uncharacterized protein YkwD